MVKWRAQVQNGFALNFLSTFSACKLSPFFLYLHLAKGDNCLFTREVVVAVAIVVDFVAAARKLER